MFKQRCVVCLSLKPKLNQGNVGTLWLADPCSITSGENNFLKTFKAILSLKRLPNQGMQQLTVDEGSYLPSVTRC